MTNLIQGDCLIKLKEIEDNSIDLVLTDPPYFLDKLDNNWSYENVNSEKNQQVVTSLPAGMKFDRQQGIEFYNWYIKISKEILRVLKPGGFFFSFSSPRLYHRMASAMDDAGFLIKDCFIWLYTQNQAKAMSLDHFINKMDITNDEKEEIKKRFNGWKTPQIKSCFEPICMGQKEPEGTLLKNMLKNEVGLFNTNIKIGDNMFPSNTISSEEINDYIDKYFLVSKPTKKEKGEYNTHKTVKPIDICEYIIKLSVFSSNAIILDPFMGSGSTGVAAKQNGYDFIGIEMEEEYIKIAKERIENYKVQNNLIN